MTFGRELIQVVEVLQTQCQLEYGVAPCTAALGTTGVRKCYNTLQTCQDRDNFDEGTLTLRFAASTEGLPVGQTVFPALRKVTTSPTEINTGGASDKKGALGKRATVRITLTDFPYHDRLTDKYAAGRVDGTAQNDEGGYDPAARGTFWGKWLARNPYYEGTRVRILEGEAGQAFSSMRAREYVIDKIEGPTEDGTVTIRAKDLLELANEDKAQAPLASGGELRSDISDSDTLFLLDPPGVGNDEYPTSGLARIGGEIVAYTRSNDSVTLTDRGARGTEAASHSAGDTFQQVLEYTDMRIDQIARDLIETYANVPSSFWAADNDTEAENFLQAYTLTGIVSEPTGVDKLLAEFAEIGIDIWWDEVDQVIRIRANRGPVGEELTSLSESADILEGSLQVADKPEQRVSQLWVYYDRINPTESLDDEANYRRRFIRLVDSQLEDDAGKRVRKIFSRWLTPGNQGAIEASTKRKVERFKHIPQEMALKLDARQRSIWTGDFVAATTRRDVDVTGAAQTRNWQVISAEDSEPGHAAAYKLLSLDLGGAAVTRPCYVVANDTPDYVDATDAQRDPKGGFIVDSNTLEFSDGSGPYQIV